jgi:protease-4
MTLDTDLLTDRRRLKRRLVFWRVVAVLAIVGVVLVATGGNVAVMGRRHVARLDVTGIITADRDLTRKVAELADAADVPALLVYIDSPGGSVSGGEALHDAIARVAAKKPVVAVMGGTAASAGYMIAVPAARIFASNATLTGSIGVILETGEVSGLLDKLGITAQAIVSGPLKDQPSFTRPLSSQGHEYLQGLVGDLYDQFVTMVADGRHMTPAAVRALADGRAFTGRQALPLGLIDQIGGEADAREWLAQARGIAVDLPIDPVQVRSWTERAFRSVLGAAPQALAKLFLSQWLTLDGAWALWQATDTP